MRTQLPAKCYDAPRDMSFVESHVKEETKKPTCYDAPRDMSFVESHVKEETKKPTKRNDNHTCKQSYNMRSGDKLCTTILKFSFT